MQTSAASTITTLRLAAFYKVNQGSIAVSQVRVASGQRVSRPSDDMAGYFIASDRSADINGFAQIRRELTAGGAAIDMAKRAGELVYSELDRMSQLLKLYYGPDATDSDRTSWAIEFNAVKARVIDEIANTWYDGNQLVKDSGSTPLVQVMIDPRDFTQKFSLSFDANDVADASGLTLGVSGRAAEESALQAQMDKALSYLAKANVAGDEVAAISNLVDLSSGQYQNVVEAVQNTDEGAEMMALVKKEICQQVAASMLAQSSMVPGRLVSMLGNIGAGAGAGGNK